MPQPKKAGSARRSPATKKPGPKPGQKVNKDGTPRKKPGPAPGTPRGQKSVTRKSPTAARKKPGPKPGAKRGGPRGARTAKVFNIYAVDGNELSFAVEAKGTSGPGAIASAVEAGTLAADTPYVALTPDLVKNPTEIEAVEQAVQYRVKTGTTRKKPGPKPAAEKPAASARGGKKAAEAAEPAPPAPGETSTNPFVENAD